MKRQVMTVVGAALCAALCGAGPASASAATWRVQTVPKPPGSVVARLFGVSCPSLGNCTAVGFSNTKPVTTRGDVLAEHWNGTSWAIQHTPSLRHEGILLSVSCPSVTACTAVGLSVEPLAEHWDGTSWAVQPVPFPAGSANAQPHAVSCASPTSCTAVGVYYLPEKDDGLPLAEHWDGTSWAVQQVPMPSGAVEADLTGVSCPKATRCIAVGYYNGSTGGIPFAERWNGSTWTAQAMPDPGFATPSGVSCTSPAACTAVGTFNGGTGPDTLAERWNGTAWTVQTVGGPLGSGLNAVSCPWASSCTAVGSAIYRLPDGTFTYIGLAAHWNGTSWATRETPPIPTSAASVDLNGVSCRSATYCTATGYHNSTKPLAIHE